MKLKSIVNRTLFEQSVINDMCLFMEQNINKEDYYIYESVPPFGDSYWKFISVHGIDNRIRLLKYIDKKTKKEYFEIKFGMFDSDTNTIIFNEPPENDHKVFNTHVKIAMDEIVSKHPEINEYRLPIVDEDPRRARLYKMAINKYLNKKEWSIDIDNKNTIYLKRKE
jgi:hypothetical protein